MKRCLLLLIALPLACSGTSVETNAVGSTSSRITINQTISILPYLPLTLASFQAAANALCAAPNTELYFPPGTYPIDGTVTRAVYANANGSLVRFEGCHDVRISGTGAKIDVKGNFNKGVDSGTIADTYAITPFYFHNSHDFEVVGFEIDGNADLTTASSPTLDEATEHAFELDNVYNFALNHLNIHHMLADGIAIESNAYNGTISDVTIDHCNRDALTFGYSVRDVEVLYSTLSHPGETENVLPNGYPPHAGRAAVDVEPECVVPALPLDGGHYCPSTTEWPATLTGNLLFDHVTFITNNTQGIVASSAAASANVTVRNSTFTSEATAYISTPGTMFRLGIPGVSVSSSTISLGYDTLEACYHPSADQAIFGAGGNSGVYASYLAQLEGDSWATSRGVYTQPWYPSTRRVPSTTFSGNTISGKRTLFNCNEGTGELTVSNNHFIGQQTNAISGDPSWIANFYARFDGTPPAGANYTPSLQVLGNWFEVTVNTPATGTVVLSGNDRTIISYYRVNHLMGNKYSAIETTTAPVYVVAYQKLGFAPIVNGDHFQDQLPIVPADYGVSPYPLTTCTVNGVDCLAGFTKTLDYP